MSSARERKSWEYGSGRFLYRYSSTGTVVLHKPLPDGRTNVSRCEFEGDSSYCKLVPVVKVVKMIEPPIPEHVWQLPDELQSAARKTYEKGANEHDARLMAASIVQKEREASIRPSEITEVLINRIGSPDEIRLTLDLWRKDKDEVRSILRSIYHVIHSGFRMDEPIKKGRKSEFEWDGKKDPAEMSYAELYSAACQLGIPRNKGMSRRELHSAVAAELDRLKEAVSG